MSITILYNRNRTNAVVSVLYPFLITKFSKNFSITSNETWALSKDNNPYLLLVGWFRTERPYQDNLVFLDKLRKKYQVLAYFDDMDGTDVLYSAYMDYFDLWFKKQVFKDKQLYLNKMKGGKIFTDFYFNKLTIYEESPEPTRYIENTQNIAKLRSLWNLNIGQYPISGFRIYLSYYLMKLFNIRIARIAIQKPKMGKQRKPKPQIMKCHARFDFKRYRESVGYQRKIFLDRVRENPLFLTGLVPKKQYDRELSQVMGVLSPFGWGEICYRDSEAIRNGALLFKPSMDHVETWPDVYIPYKTYIPLDWDAKDVLDKVDQYLRNPELFEEITTNAWNVLLTAEQELDKRVQWFIDEMRSCLP